MSTEKDMEALSPLDGRYRKRLKGLHRYLSEEALIRYRAEVECRYLRKLCDIPELHIRKLKPKEELYLQQLYRLTHKDILAIITIENSGTGRIPPTKHDVKAVEYFLKSRLERSSLKDLSEYVHFGLTSEDINNISYSLMIRDAIGLLAAELAALRDKVDEMARSWAEIPLLARTHGQPAVPTTFGKELRVFCFRLDRQLDTMGRLSLPAKLNGAVGNYNAHVAAFPEADWELFSREFIEGFNRHGAIRLEFNPCTTQIESHDGLAELCHLLFRINTILLGLSRDMWRYISSGLVTQKAVKGEVGSSTMPQKVNPIDFENAEGNLGIANALLAHFAEKLPVTRLQRDLSDSTVLRNLGVAFGHCLLSYSSLSAGLGKVRPDEEAARAELLSHPEAVTEGLQTILRRERLSGAYEKLSAFARGRRVSAEELKDFIARLPVGGKVKAELLSLSPLTYTGLAVKLAKSHKED